MIPFNKPYLTGKELEYIKDSINSGKISGNGKYSVLCQDLFKIKYGFDSCLLTTSCTDALEMAAILIDIQPGDEVIMPSYTFVSTANPFILRGAKIIFIDSRTDHPGLDEESIEQLITKKTKAIVPVHYAGSACNMEKLMFLANKYNLWVVEDAAQAIDSYYINSKDEKSPLGSIGHLAAFSFHETKNIISGEGGMLVINDKKLKERAEIIWEKGTNRSAFFRGEVDKYGWVDIGSSFLPSDLIAAFLYAQLENISNIQQKRSIIWNTYYTNLKELEEKNILKIQSVPQYSTANFHMFYIICPTLEFRENLTKYLSNNNIHVVFHYQSLHNSKYYKDQHDGRKLENSDNYSDCLLRLPMFYELTIEEVEQICNHINNFCINLLNH
jgi:dTDP-4-amino-4,6-dideoxygalactose transaminase